MVQNLLEQGEFFSSLLVRADSDAGSVVHTLEGAVHDVEPNLALSRVVTLAQSTRSATSQERQVTWLLGVAASDPVNLASVGLLMLLVALAGSYLPARSASRVNPVSVLRRD